MTIVFKTGLAAALCMANINMAQAAQPQRPYVIEADLSFGQLSRGGTAINSNGPFADEFESSELVTFSGTIAIPVHDHWLLQFEGRSERNTAPDFADINLGRPTDDTYSNSFLAGVQAGRYFNNFYVGSFSALGKTRFTLDDVDQNSTYEAYGVAAAYHAKNASYSLQVGHLDTSAENPESLSDTTFGAVTAKRFFNNDKTAISASFAIANGTQDTDSSAPNDLDITVFGVSIEHKLPVSLFGAHTSAYFSYERLEADEGSSSGSTDTVNDSVLTLGVRVLFGAQSQRSRTRNSAQSLPNFGRWVGSVPAVD